MNKTAKGRLNIVEIIIFGAVVTTFGYSIFQLVNPNVVNFNTTVQTASESTGGSRALASLNTQKEFEIGCDNAQAYKTEATQIRLNGALCGRNSHAKILNQANQFQVAVFSDAQKSRYTTEYIPLNPGKNPIYLEFINEEGKTLSQIVTVTLESNTASR